jgi:hypothetical protein
VILLAIPFGITSRDGANRIMLLCAERWDDLIGEMTCKITPTGCVAAALRLGGQPDGSSTASTT